MTNKVTKCPGCGAAIDAETGHTHFPPSDGGENPPAPAPVAPEDDDDDESGDQPGGEEIPGDNPDKFFLD